MKQIKITCSGQKTLPIDALDEFQGNLKESTDEEVQDLKNLIIKKGFSFPVFVWGNKILDGHRRIFAAKELINEGWAIDEIPICEIDAASETEAAEKLLMLNGRFGRITAEGLEEFLTNYDVDLELNLPELRLADIDINEFLNKKEKDQGHNENDDDLVPNKDSNVLIRLSFHPGIWMSKREEIMAITGKMEKTYNCGVKVEE